jgi:hypothetical protein
MELTIAVGYTSSSRNFFSALNIKGPKRSPKIRKGDES